MTIAAGERRRIVSTIAHAVAWVEDPGFMLHVHELPDWTVGARNEADMAAQLRRQFWALDDSKLVAVAQDLWPRGFPIQDEDDELLARYLHNLQIAAEEDRATQVTATANIESLKELSESADRLVVVLRKEVDSGAASDPEQWEFEARILEIYVSPSTKRAALTLEMLAGASNFTSSELASAVGEITSEESVLKRLALGVSEPRVVGLLNAALSALRLVLG